MTSASLLADVFFKYVFSKLLLHSLPEMNGTQRRNGVKIEKTSLTTQVLRVKIQFCDFVTYLHMPINLFSLWI